MTDSVPRDQLVAAFGGSIRVTRAIEQQMQKVDTVTTRLASTAAATDSIQDATVIVLSSNAAFDNERVLRVGPGIDATDDGTSLYLDVSDSVAKVDGGHGITLVAAGETTVAVPLTGILSTLSNMEVLSGKTLDAPSLSNITSYASDDDAPTGAVYLVDGSTALHYKSE